MLPATRNAMIVALLAAAAVPTLAADAETRRPVELTTTQRVALAPGGTVRIDETWGELSIEGWDEPAVEVVTTRRTAKGQRADEEAEARARLERFAARVEATAPGTVSIIGLSPKGSVIRPFGGKSGVNLRYVIRVPKSANIELDNGAGAVRIAGVHGDISVDSDVGEVEVGGPIEATAAVEASSGVGDVDINAPIAGQGELRRSALVGQRFRYQPSTVERRITVKLGVGTITIG